MAAARTVTYEEILRNIKAQKIAPVYYLMGEEDYYIDRLSDAIVDAVLAEEEKDIPTRPALGTIKVHDPYGGDNMDSDYVNYQYKVSQFNSQCNSILSIAIKCKNTYLAQRAVAKTKTNISYRNLGDWEHVVLRTTNSSWNYAWKVTLDNTEANAIKAAYQEAVRSGAFK